MTQSKFYSAFFGIETHARPRSVAERNIGAKGKGKATEEIQVSAKDGLDDVDDEEVEADLEEEEDDDEEEDDEDDDDEDDDEEEEVRIRVFYACRLLKIRAYRWARRRLIPQTSDHDVPEAYASIIRPRKPSLRLAYRLTMTMITKWSCSF